MNLIERIRADMVAATKGREQVRADTLRMLLSSIRNAEIAKKGTLTEDEIMGQIQKGVKTRKEAIEGYAKGGRAEMKAKEEPEMAILEAYLPARMSDAELSSLVDAAISEAGAAGPADMGKVMKLLVPKIAGRADSAAASQLVKKKLSAKA